MEKIGFDSGFGVFYSYNCDEFGCVIFIAKFRPIKNIRKIKNQNGILQGFWRLKRRISADNYIIETKLTISCSYIKKMEINYTNPKSTRKKQFSEPVQVSKNMQRIWSDFSKRAHWIFFSCHIPYCQILQLIKKCF